MNTKIENSNTGLSRVKLIEVKTVKNLKTYNKFINWVIGEFDLYLKNESNILKVYFPNGQFSIRNSNISNKDINVEIKVEGKSKVACEKVMNQLQNIYSRVIHFDSYGKHLINDISSR